jgi:uncharacterized protein (TIGR03435 family)
VRPAVRKAAGASARVGPDGMGGGFGACPTSVKIDRSRVAVRCANVAMLIGYAYRLSPDRITGLDSLTSLGAPRFDIEATIPQEASQNKVPEMFQALLADRFKLVVHREAETQAVLALVAAKGGPKLTSAAPEAPSAPAPAAVADSDPDSPPSIESFAGEVHDRTTRNADGSGEITTVSSPRMGTVRWTASSNHRNWRLEASTITFEGLAELLNRVIPLPSPVVDMTRLKGRYQMLLDISLNDALVENASMMERDDAVLRGFNDGLRKLGLQLERRKGPVETLFVDHVEKTPTDN